MLLVRSTLVTNSRSFGGAQGLVLSFQVGRTMRSEVSLDGSKSGSPFDVRLQAGVGQLKKVALNAIGCFMCDTVCELGDKNAEGANLN